MLKPKLTKWVACSLHVANTERWRGWGRGGGSRAGLVTALLLESAHAAKDLAEEGGLADLNNWWGIMLLDAASKITSIIINNRL